jgi:hypothetical protein
MYASYNKFVYKKIHGFPTGKLIFTTYVHLKSRWTQLDPKVKVEGSVRFLDGVKNCTDSIHKFSRAFLLCYEFVQFLTPSKNLTDPSTFRT